MAGTYQYQPLPDLRSIRLLELDPSPDRSSPLSCRLRHASMDKPPPYEALSYVWGSTNRDHHILCQGGRIPITANCEAALRRLRDKSRPRVLWVDAICIEQSSRTERGSQVLLMGDIFYRADQVLVWLGEEGDTTDVAFKYLRRVALVCKTSISRSLMGPSLVKKLRRFDAEMKEEDDGLVPTPFMQEIFDNPWFKRMWTIQEVVMSRRCLVVCGRFTMPWRSFHAAGDFLAGYLGQRYSVHWSLWKTFNVFPDSSKDNKDDFWPHPQSPGHILSAIRRQRATDPRDKIYALYWIFRTLKLDIPKPDYTKSVVEVYQDTMIAVIRQTNSLDFLRFVPSLHRSVGDLPTWVADFSDADAWPPQTEANVSAAKDSCADPSILNGNKHLCVRGKVIDRVIARSDMVDWRDKVPNGEIDPIRKSMYKKIFAINAFREWTRMTLALSTYPTGESTITAFLRTLVKYTATGRNWEKKPFTDDSVKVWHAFVMAKDPAFDIGLLEEVLKQCPFSLNPRLAIDPAWRRLERHPDFHILRGMELHPESKAMFDVLRERFYDNAFFTTVNGYIGTAFYDVQEDDLVVLLSGSKLPVILRSSDEHYRFVSGAYVHGIMQGQAWPEDGSLLSEIVLV